MLCLGAKIFQKITLKTIKLVIKTDKKADKNRQKPIKLSVSKNYSVGFCRFGKTDKMSTKTDKGALSVYIPERELTRCKKSE